MVDISPLLNNPQLQANQAFAAVSEANLQTIAGAQTFINYFTYEQKRFDFNGPYPDVAAFLPFAGTDNVSIFEFSAQVIDVWLYCQVPGSSGSTTIDLQIMNTPGGTWTSIFTTLPSISYQAGTDVWVGSVNPSLIGSQYAPSPAYTPPVNTTAGVLNSSISNLIPAWTAIRAVMTASQNSPASNACIIVHYRNTNAA